MIVVDSNILAYFFIPGRYTKNVERLRLQDSDWVAPRLWQDEFANILCAYERTRQLTAEQTLELAVDALELIRDNSFSISFERVLAVARKTGCSAYDSQYIALSEDLGVPLYTFDRKILVSCPEIAKAPK